MERMSESSDTVEIVLVKEMSPLVLFLIKMLQFAHSHFMSIFLLDSRQNYESTYLQLHPRIALHEVQQQLSKTTTHQH